MYTQKIERECHDENVFLKADIGNVTFLPFFSHYLILIQEYLVGRPIFHQYSQSTLINKSYYIALVMQNKQIY